MLAVPVAAGHAELAVGAGAAGTGTQRFGGDLAAVQILRHLGQQAVQVVADAPQLGFVGQPPLAVGDELL